MLGYQARVTLTGKRPAPSTSPAQRPPMPAEQPPQAPWQPTEQHGQEIYNIDLAHAVARIDALSRMVHNQVATIAAYKRALDTAQETSTALEQSLAHEIERLAGEIGKRDNIVTGLRKSHDAVTDEMDETIAALHEARAKDLAGRDRTISGLQAELSSLTIAFEEEHKQLTKATCDTRHYHRKCTFIVAELLELKATLHLTPPSTQATTAAAQSPAAGSPPPQAGPAPVALWQETETGESPALQAGPATVTDGTATEANSTALFTDLFAGIPALQ